jgi:hypothetical protein
MKPRTTVEAITHGKRDTSFVHREERPACVAVSAGREDLSRAAGLESSSCRS